MILYSSVYKQLASKNQEDASQLEVPKTSHPMPEFHLAHLNIITGFIVSLIGLTVLLLALKSDIKNISSYSLIFLVLIPGFLYLSKTE